MEETNKVPYWKSERGRAAAIRYRESEKGKAAIKRGRENRKKR